MEVVYGIHSVSEALRSRAQRIDYVAIARERHDAKLQRIIDDCRASGISVRFLPRPQLDRTARTANHQGVVAVTAAKQYAEVDALLANKRGQHSLVVVLDGVQDPQNLGAVIRTAEAAGADGVVIPERRAVGVTGTVAKASAGASEYLPIARVTNIARTLEELKAANIWTVGLDERAPQSYDQVDYKMNCALVLGAEGSGLHDLVRKKCDFLVSLPMLGRVPSLNVSVAAGIVLYEILRQRSSKEPRRRGSAEEAGH
jgi:23S rRNA (guanosine2251-2'-O)-methyltransferase